MSDCKGVKLITKLINAGKYFIGTEIAHVPSLYLKKIENPCVRKGINQEAKSQLPTVCPLQHN